MHACRLDLLTDDLKFRVESITVIPIKRTVATATSNGGQPVSPGSAPVQTAVDTGLVVGCGDGTITVYRVTPASEAGEVVLKRTSKRSVDTGKYPVTQVLYEPRLRDPRVVALSNGKVSCFRLSGETLEPLHIFANVKALDGVSLCCISQPAPGTLLTALAGGTVGGTGDPARFAALVRKQLLLYDIGESTASPFLGRDGENAITISEGVMQMEWCGNQIIIGTKRDYSVYDARTQQLKDQLVFGRGQSGPLMQPLRDGTLAIRSANNILIWNPLARNQTFDTLPSFPLVDQGGNADEVTTFTSSGAFYLVALANGKFDLRSIYNRSSYPNPPPNVISRDAVPRVAATAKDMVFLASPREIHAYWPVPVMSVVDGYVAAAQFSRAVGHYQTALQPTDNSSSSLTQFETGLRNVYGLCAKQAIALGALGPALDNFQLANSEALVILPYFPSLQSAEVAKYVNTHGESVPSKATARTTSELQQHSSKLYSILERQRVRDLTDLQQRAIDHALLMLLITDAIPESVMSRAERAEALEDLFLPSNNLRFEEALNALQVADGLSPVPKELLQRCHVLLRSTHGRPGEALDYAKANGKVAEAVLVLQQHQQTALVTAHMPWMVVADSLLAVNAVCVRDSELSPDAVLGLLSGCSHQVLRQYLGFCIHENACNDPDVHTQYALALLALLAPLRGITSTRKRHNVAPLPGEEAGLFGELRRELLLFLPSSKLYDGDAVLAALRAARVSRQQAPFAGYSDDDELPSPRDELSIAASSRRSTASSPPNEQIRPEMMLKIRVLRIYRRYKPDNVANMDEVLQKYQGKDDELIDALVRKYGPEPSPEDDDEVILRELDRESQQRKLRRRSTWLMHEEALIHARHADHTAVLMLYVYRLRDVKLAEHYCFSTFVTEGRVPSIGAKDKGLDDGGAASVPGLRSKTGAGANGAAPPRPGAVGGGATLVIPKPASGGSFGSSGQVGVNRGAKAPSSAAGKAGGSSTGATGGGTFGQGRAVTASTRTSACLTDLILVLLIPPRGCEPLQEEAIRILDTYSDYISPLAVVEALPGDVKFSTIASYVAHIAVRNANGRTMGEITKQSINSRKFELERLRIGLQSRHVYVDRERPCVVCGKPLGNAIFAVFPNLRTAHFRCFKDKECDPQRGVPFRAVVDPSL